MPAPSLRISLPRFLTAAGVLLGSLLTGWLLVIHGRMVVSPAPQEMREGAVPWITRLLLEGRNPYALAELPAGADVYGILYHLLVVPFARVFGNGFAVHRTISAVAILAACGVMYSLLRGAGTERVLAWIGTLLFYAASVYFTGPLARPDGLAVLLSVASLWVLTDPESRFGIRGMDGPPTVAFAVGLALGLLALITKISLAFPPFIVAAHLAAFGKGAARIRGVLYGTVASVSALGLLAVMNHRYPAYVTLTFAANAQSGFSDGEHLRRQTLDFLIFALPLTVACLLAVWRWSARLVTGVERPAAPTVHAFGAIANACVFFLWLGWHPGAHMTYLFQLVMPLLLPAVLPALSGLPWPRASVAAALPVSLVLSAPYFSWTFERFRTAEDTFARLNDQIARHRTVLGGTEVAGLLALHGRPVIDSGQSEYFGEAIGRRTLPGTLSREVLRERWEGMFAGMERSLRGGEYDLVVRSRRAGLIPLRVVTERYRRIDSVWVTFAWCGQTWLMDLYEPE